MLRRSRFNLREDETPGPEGAPEAERALANAVIAAGLKHDPERVGEVLIEVVRSFKGRYSADEISAAVDQLLDELDAHAQPRSLTRRRATSQPPS